MKKGYIRLLIFSLLLIILSLFNAFVVNIFSGYKIVIFLLIVLVVFNQIFVMERNRRLYYRDILFEILLFSLTYFIVYYLLGLVVGLAWTSNYLTMPYITGILIPIILYCILREILRYNMISKADNNMLCTIIVIILFIILDISNAFYFTLFNSQYDVLKFIALAFLPAVSKNISYSYISKRIGYKPLIIFDLIFSLYLYILPIVPNINEYVMSIIYLIVPILFAFKILRFYEAKKNDKISSNYHAIKLKHAIVPAILVFTLVYFYSGYFRFYTIAVATGSMSPNINKGDVVIVDKKYSFNNLEVGDIIAYRKEGVIIIHRIAKKVSFGDSYLLYTKGDANNNMDDFVIKEDMIVGNVKQRIRYIGYPTVWFNEK